MLEPLTTGASKDGGHYLKALSFASA